MVTVLYLTWKFCGGEQASSPHRYRIVLVPQGDPGETMPEPFVAIERLGKNALDEDSWSAHRPASDIDAKVLLKCALARLATMPVLGEKAPGLERIMIDLGSFEATP